MGWCRGSYIANDIFVKGSENMPESKKNEFAQMIYDVFCDQDADCWDSRMEIIMALREDQL